MSKTDLAMANLAKQLELPESPTAATPKLFEIFATLIDELRVSGRAVSKSGSELTVLLKMLSGQQHIKNITVLGTLTQLWPRDAFYIESALKNLDVISSELQQLERDAIAWKELSDLQNDQLNVILNRRTEVLGSYEKTLSDLKKQMFS